jgi:hypothetical protein
MSEPKSNKADALSMLILLGGVIVVGFVIVALTMSGRSQEPPSRSEVAAPAVVAGPVETTSPAKQTACNDRMTAYVMAQDFVSSRLKAPASARFPTMAAGDAIVAPMAGCKFMVVAYVDSQNSFGAQVRAQFVATLTAPQTGDKWQLDSLEMDQQ